MVTRMGTFTKHVFTISAILPFWSMLVFLHILMNILFMKSIHQGRLIRVIRGFLGYLGFLGLFRVIRVIRVIMVIRVIIRVIRVIKVIRVLGCISVRLFFTASPYALHDRFCRITRYYHLYGTDTVWLPLWDHLYGTLCGSLYGTPVGHPRSSMV